MTKKLAAIFVAFALYFSLFTVSAFAAEDPKVPYESSNVPQNAIAIEYGLAHGETATHEGFVGLLSKAIPDASGDVSKWTYYQKATLLSKYAYVPIDEDTTQSRIYKFSKLAFPDVDADQWQIYSMKCNNTPYTVALKLTDARESVVTFKANSLELSFSGDLSTAEGVAQLKSMIYDGIIDECHVPLGNLTLEYLQGVILGYEVWQPFSSDISAKLDSQCKLRISHSGNEQYKPVQNYPVTLNLIDGRKPAATFTGDSLVLSFSGDLSTEEGLAQLKAKIYDGIIDECNVPCEEFALEYKTSSILNPWKDLDANISTDTGSEYTLRIKHSDNKAFKPVEHEFTLIFDNRKPTSISLNENTSIVYNEDCAALEAAALKQIVNSTSGLPSDAQLNISYHTNVKLTDSAKAQISSAVLGALDFMPASLREIARAAISSALDKALGKTDMDAWVSFAGKNVTVSSEELGLADAIRDIKYLSDDTKQRLIDTIDGVLGKTPLELEYPPISVDKYDVRVSYTSASDPDFKDYRPCAAEGKLIVKPAPVKLSVASGSIYVDDAINGSLKATRTDNGKTIDSVAGLTLYAGITSNAKALITLDLTDKIKNEDAYIAVRTALAAANIDIDNGVTLKDLFGDTEKLEKIRSVFKTLGLDNSFDGILMDALEKALENALGDRFDKDTFEQLINGAADGQMGEFLKKLESSLGEGLDSVVANVGDSVIFRLGTPEGNAGAYAVVGYLGDEHYKAESAWNAHAVGYLLIKFHKVAVNVDNRQIGPEDTIESMVSTDPADAEVFTIYTGVTSGLTTAVYLDVPQTAQFAGVKTVGDLRTQMVKTPEAFLQIMGIDSSFYAKVLAAAAGLDNLDADIPVTYGKPEGQTGAYAVTALAYSTKDGKPWGYGIGTGTLTVGYGTISLTVNHKEVCEDTTEKKIRDGLIEVYPEDANVVTVFIGVTEDGEPLIYIDGIGDVNGAEVFTVNELVNYIADNSEVALGKIGVDNTTIAKLFSKLLDGDEVLGKTGNAIKVQSGVPTQVGVYGVYALAGARGYIPAIAHNGLAILHHSWGLPSEFKAPTCTESGFRTVTCKRCDLTETQEIPATGHWEITIPGKKATCTEDGYTESSYCIKCCQTVKQRERIPATGHQWDEGVIVEKPTCTGQGSKRYTCTVCKKATYDEAVNPAGHTPETVPAVAPTCTETGLTKGSKCSVCDDVLEVQDVVPALGHDEKVRPGVAPTCLDTGLTEGKYCDRCKVETVPQTVVDALGHDVVVDAAVDAQCTETGLTEGAHCDRCNTILTAREVTPAIGHAYGEWRVVREATADMLGLQERVCAHNPAHVEQQSIAYVVPGGGDTPGDGGGAGTDGGATAATADAGTAAGAGAETAAAAAVTAVPGNPTPLSQNVTNNETPLAPGLTSDWSLVSLISMIATIALAIFLAVRTVTGNRKTIQTILAAVIGVVSLAAFFMTNDLTGAMVAINASTFLSVVLLIISAGAVIFASRDVQPNTGAHA